MRRVQRARCPLPRPRRVDGIIGSDAYAFARLTVSLIEVVGDGPLASISGTARSADHRPASVWTIPRAAWQEHRRRPPRTWMLPHAFATPSPRRAPDGRPVRSGVSGPGRRSAGASSINGCRECAPVEQARLRSQRRLCLSALAGPLIAAARMVVAQAHRSMGSFLGASLPVGTASH